MGTVFRILQSRTRRRLAMQAFCLFFTASVFAQNAQPDEFQKLIDFLPPAPNAAAIAKAGMFNLNKNTGAPSVNIPLYTLKGRKLAMNVGLTYATNGIKVDEIASRVGMGWSLNAGGVVTRMVRGVPDEMRPRQYPWFEIGNNWATFNYMKKVSMSDNATGIDSQPDLFTFNFNGVSGSFVFAGDMTVVQIPYGNLIIEYNFAPTASWNFRITTADGVKYFFGGVNATEKTKRDQTCGKTFNTYLPTSWYLTRVEHPTGDVINLAYDAHEYTYDNGSSESVEVISNNVAIGGNCNFTSSPQTNVSDCINYTRTKGFYLSSITNSSGWIHFTYSSRSDCSDVLLSSVEVYNMIHGSNLVKKYNFFYLNSNTVPYLSMIKDNSQDLVDGIFYQFMYNDPNSRPARLSKSQDHWGYYNGKINPSLLPREKSLVDPNFYTYYYYFSNRQYGDRTPDFNYASKGMLTRIIYPTGGMDSIIYEPNEVPNSLIKRNTTEYTCDVTGINFKDPVVRDIPFTIDQSQTVKLEISIICNEADCPDVLHNIGRVSVENSIYSDNYATGTNTTKLVALPAGSYILKLQANGSAVTTRVKMTYLAPSVQLYDKYVTGGVRVKALLSGNPNEKPVYKRFYYSYLNNLEGSSMSQPFNTVYIKLYQSREMSMQEMGANFSFQQCVRDHTILYSNSIRNVFDYASSLVSYASVVESIGENFEGGGTSTEYYVGSDQLGRTVWGNDIQDAPMDNRSVFYNGKVLREKVLKKDANGSLVTIQKTENEYIEDVSAYKTVLGYAVFRKNGFYFDFDTTCNSDVQIDQTNYSCYYVRSKLLLSFDMMEFRVFAPWIYLKSTTVTNYDENGQNPVVVTTDYFYENMLHQQVTRSETHNSKQELIKTENKYPHDYANGSNVYSQMRDLNIIATPVSSKTWKNNAAVAEVKTNFKDWGNNNFAPESIQKAYRDNNPEIEGTINHYDIYGNITEYRGKDGITNAIIYGYNYHYPVAKVSGATYAQAVAQLAGGVSALQTMTESQLRTALAQLYTGLPGAFVTTYTYNPNIGVTSITDNNRNTSYFEYDKFGRLHTVRDNENNILKTIDYAYAGPDGTQYYKLYFNDPQYQVFKCQNCPSGTTGSEITYIVPAKKHFSFTSIDDANAKALADIQANGQHYANINGYCSNTAFCTLTGYAVVDCACELGAIFPVSCSDNPDGTWVQNYKYKWSNNTLSTEIYTRTLPACVGPEKKRVGCNCFLGLKLLSSTYQNADGTWTCVYRYRYTDGSFSNYIYEINNAPCSDGIE